MSAAGEEGPRVDEAEMRELRARYADRRFSMGEDDAGPKLKFGDLDGFVFEDGLHEDTGSNLVMWLNRMLESAKAATINAAAPGSDRGEVDQITIGEAEARNLCTDLKRELSAAEVRAERAERERDGARGVLRKCEEQSATCPVCDAALDYEEPHKPDCALAAQLGGPAPGLEQLFCYRNASADSTSQASVANDLGPEMGEESTTSVEGKSPATTGDFAVVQAVGNPDNLIAQVGGPAWDASTCGRSTQVQADPAAVGRDEQGLDTSAQPPVNAPGCPLNASGPPVDASGSAVDPVGAGWAGVRA